MIQKFGLRDVEGGFISWLRKLKNRSKNSQVQSMSQRIQGELIRAGCSYGKFNNNGDWLLNYHSLNHNTRYDIEYRYWIYKRQENSRKIFSWKSF